MRFDQDRFAAFDLHILQRPEASAEYSEAAQARAKQVFAAMTQADIDHLVTNIASALPGSTTDPLTIPQFRDRLAAVSRHRLRRAAPASERISRARDAGGGSARRDADAASGRSAAPAVRPAAHRLVGGRLSGAVRRRSVQGQRHLLLHRLARRARGKRPAGDGETLRAADRLCPSAGDQAGEATACRSSSPIISTAMST